MKEWQIWILVGVVMILLELIIPGGVIIFLGLAAMCTSALLYFGFINTIMMAFVAWFIITIFLMFTLRSIFIKYFEGDSTKENVDEDKDLVGSIVSVIEDVVPYKEGRVKFRDTTWLARSDEEITQGSRAVISGRDGNSLIIKSI